MSFDIFKVSKLRFYILVPLLLLSLVAVFVLLKYPVFDGLSTETIGWIGGLFLVCIFAVTLWAAITENNFQNIDEVKGLIQEKYGIELSDESLKFLYGTRGYPNGREFYVADVNGNGHKYFIIGSEFHFIK